MSRNEAAERLRQAFHIWASEGIHPSTWLSVLDEALATERRLTVERVREAARNSHLVSHSGWTQISAILDALVTAGVDEEASDG